MPGTQMIIRSKQSSLRIKHADFPVQQVMTVNCKQLAFVHFSGPCEMTSHTQL